VTPLVSVVIPCYGQARFLADAVASALAQTYPPFEVIVINDGSPDSSAMDKVLAPFQTRITYLTQENQGLSGARNAGLRRCTGDYVVFLDADDRLLPNALGTGAEALSACPTCALVWGLRRIIDAEGLPLRSNVGTVEHRPTYADLLRTNIIGPPVGVMFRRSALNDIDGFSSIPECAEDYDAYLRVAQRHEIEFHGEVIAEYRVHGGNMSRNARRMFAGVMQVLDRQAHWVGKDAELRNALRLGRLDARERYDWDARIDELGGHAREGRWVRASACAALLLAKYPRRFAPVLMRRARRSVLHSGR
jgi:glycosyltransferase involved in cell wall biosynthesis